MNQRRNREPNGAYQSLSLRTINIPLQPHISESGTGIAIVPPVEHMAGM